MSCPTFYYTPQSEKQMHNHQQSRAHRKMVEELQAEFGDDVLEGLEEGEDEDGEELDDKDLRAFEAAAEAAASAEVGEGGGNGHVEVEGERQDDGGEEEAEVEKGEAEEEESSEDEDVGQVSRGVNRFAFGDDSSSEEDG